VDWLLAELAAAPSPRILGGHSMGAALAVGVAAALLPERVERLVLVGPAGLRLTKPIRRSAAQFASQAWRRQLAARDVVVTCGC
jgi:pimeloyl-ACP methyl ester carboxylesterase